MNFHTPNKFIIKPLAITIKPKIIKVTPNPIICFLSKLFSNPFHRENMLLLDV